MSKHAEVEILLVEDNPNDAEFSLRALKKIISPIGWSMSPMAKRRWISFFPVAHLVTARLKIDPRSSFWI